VLQAVFSFERNDLPIFVGQQMDVFIDAGSSTMGALPSELTKQK
jgi:hypothetical protein